MLGWVFGRRRAVSACVALSSWLGSVDAAHAVTQPPPDSTPLPQPVPTAELTVVVSRSFPESAVRLDGLFAFRSESIDPALDALADPGTFRPLCGGVPVQVEFVLHGGGCSLGLAWYNATGSTPAASELYTAVPSSVTTDMGCSIADFCPLASAPTVNFSWTPTVYSLEEFCDDPRYTGGDIGFALVGNPATVCPATKYSERASNVVCTSCTPPVPWVTTLIYRATSRRDAYYVAFEDLPMSPTDWRAPTTSSFMPDGDFNDFVFYVRGVCHDDDECMGGGGSGTGGTSGTGGASGSNNAGSSNGGSNNAGSSNGGSSNGGSDSGGSNNAGSGATDTGGAAGLGEGGEGTSGSTPGACTPGRQVECTCSNGEDGSQVCREDGRSFGACDCSTGEENDVKTEGCGCRHPTSRTGGSWAIVLLLLVLLRRRASRAPVQLT